MKEIDELNSLVPDEVVVQVKNEEIIIKPFKFINLLKVLKLLLSMSEGISLENFDQFTIVKMFSDHPDEVLRVFSYATARPVNFFEDIDAAEGVELITVIYKVNEDFFQRKLRPKLEKIGVLSSSQESQTILETSIETENSNETKLNEESAKLEIETTTV